eukprot:scaffold6974_cov109-Skeletonema_dohrnii-CCMP3373.AAC.2
MSRECDNYFHLCCDDGTSSDGRRYKERIDRLRRVRVASSVLHGANSCPTVQKYQDVLSRPVERDGFEYTEYALLYVDNVLAISGNAEHVLRNEIGLEAEGSSIANRCCIRENTVENWI